MKKVVFIIIDGLPDDATQDNLTPVESAKGCAIHEIAQLSKPIMVKTIYRFLPIGSIVANLGLIGYDPYDYFPYGRSFYELLSNYKEADISDNDLIMRCNTISVDETGTITDFTAGQINDKVAEEFIEFINKKLPKNFSISHGKSYRNSLIIKNSNLMPDDLICFEPHTRVGEKYKSFKPMHSTKILTKEKKKEISLINKLLEDSKKWAREFNEAFSSKIDMLWFWEPSTKLPLPKFSKHAAFNKPVVITGSDFLVGIAMASGMAVISEPKFTGEFDTDYKRKGELAVRELSTGSDFLYVHINATDEEAHQKRFSRKVEAIRMIDREIIQPIYKYIKNKNDYVLIIGGDHYTSCTSGNHLDLDSPMIIYNGGRRQQYLSMFSEKEIIGKSGGKVIKSFKLLSLIHEEDFFTA